jgi:hypothetical protein
MCVRIFFEVAWGRYCYPDGWLGYPPLLPGLADRCVYPVAVCVMSRNAQTMIQNHSHPRKPRPGVYKTAYIRVAKGKR